jgi:catechol-2,3-dioxygenase
MSRIIGTSEIVLSVSDIALMRKFDVDVVGIPLHSEACSIGKEPTRENEEATISFLTITETDSPLGNNGHPQMLVLIDYRRHQYAKGRFDGHDVKRSTLNHLAFEILPDDYEFEFERLSRIGLNPVKAEFPNLNAKAIFFKDPEGNMLELICHQPM